MAQQQIPVASRAELDAQVALYRGDRFDVVKSGPDFAVLVKEVISPKGNVATVLIPGGGLFKKVAAAASKKEVRIYIDAGLIARNAASAAEAQGRYWAEFRSKLRAMSAEEIRAHVEGGGALIGAEGDWCENWLPLAPDLAVLVDGAARSGKTSRVLIPLILTTPSAVVTTSIRHDVFTSTVGVRSQIGRVWVLDLTDEGEPNEMAIQWSPMAATIRNGAPDWSMATLIAESMVRSAEKGGGNPQDRFWVDSAAGATALLLFAVAANMCYSDVNAADALKHFLLWRSTPDTETFDQVSVALKAAEAANAFVSPAMNQLNQLNTLLNTAPVTLGGIMSHVQAATRCFDVPAVHRASSADTFDPWTFGRERSDTVYVIAAGGMDEHLQPYSVALLEVLRHACELNNARVERRNYLWALDEVANIAPLPSLPRLISSGGGSGMQPIVVVQSIGQLCDKWGKTPEAWINEFPVRVYLGMIAEAAAITDVKTAAGSYWRAEEQYGFLDVGSVARTKEAGHFGLGNVKLWQGWGINETFNVKDWGVINVRDVREDHLTDGEIRRPGEGLGWIVTNAHGGMLYKAVLPSVHSGQYWFPQLLPPRPQEDEPATDDPFGQVARPAPPLPPAGWKDDPRMRYKNRYWDGEAWTAYVSNGGETLIDPAGI